MTTIHDKKAHIPLRRRLARESLALWFLTFVTLSLGLTLLIFSTVQVIADYRQEIADLDRKAAIQGGFLASVSPDHLLTNNFLVLERLMRQSHDDPDVVYAVIVDRRGRALTRYMNQSNPQIAEALTTHSTILDVIAHVRQHPMIDEQQSAIDLDGTNIGTVLLGYSRANVRRQLITSVQWNLATYLVTLAFLAGLILATFHWLIGRRVRTVATVVELFGAGNYQQRAPVTNDDDISRLARNFNRMADELNATMVGLHQANQALHTSERQTRKLSHVARHTSNTVIIADAAGNIEWANDSFTRLSGFTSEEIMGRQPSELIGGPGTDPATIATLRARMAAGQPFNCEVLNYAKDGTPYWVAVDLQPVHDADGTLLNFITIETDITARKLAESALRTSRQEYRALFDQASEGIFIVNQAGQFIDVNDKGCQLLGYQRAELLTLTVSDLVAKTESTNLAADFAQLALGEHLFNERQLRHRDGHLVPVEVSASRLADGRLQAYVRDISQRVQAEEVRRQYIATLEALHGTALQLATSASLDAILDTILRNSIDLLHFNYGGIYLREAEGDVFVLQRSLNTRHVRPGERILPGRGLIGQAIEYGQTLLIENYDEWPLRRDDIPAGLLGSALAVPLQHDNRLIGIIFCARPQVGSTSTDEVKLMELMAGQAEVAIERARLLTDLRTSNDELAAERRMLTQRVRERTEELSVANTELRRALRAKDGFLATMSHELRTPLTTILLLAQMMQKEIYGALPVRAAKAAVTIHKSGNHLLNLINDILDLSKIEAGQLELEMKPFAIETVANEAMEFARVLAYEKQIDLRFEVENAGLIVVADDRRIKQIMLNLLTNAIKFTPTNGKVGMVICMDHTVTDCDETDCPLHSVRIEVWDTGIGIAPDDQVRLFQPFVQLDSRLNREYEGTGLGLALVQRMAALHGGRITLESTVGVGSRFIVTLPLDKNFPSTEQTGHPTHTPSTN